MFEVRNSKKLLVGVAILITIFIALVITVVVNIETIEKKWVVILYVIAPFLIFYIHKNIF